MSWCQLFGCCWQLQFDVKWNWNIHIWFNSGRFCYSKLLTDVLPDTWGDTYHIAVQLYPKASYQITFFAKWLRFLQNDLVRQIAKQSFQWSGMKRVIDQVYIYYKPMEIGSLALSSEFPILHSKYILTENTNFTKNRKRKVEKSICRCQIDRFAKGYKRGPKAKTDFKAEIRIFGPKKSFTS